MTALNRLRLRFAAEGFLAAMNMRMIAINPNHVPRTLDSYSDKHQSILTDCVRTAIKRMDADSDEAFAKWRDEKSKEKL